jgi:hypothetical protein
MPIEELLENEVVSSLQYDKFMGTRNVIGELLEIFLGPI